MEEKLRAIITAHNQMIETIQNTDMTCNLFRGMEVWSKIAYEGAEITIAAQSIGIDAAVNMRTGRITVHEGCSNESPKTEGLTFTEIISSLEDQALDKGEFADEDDPECILRQDVAALRAAAKLLRKVELLI